jgi:sugar lactone lactonase YvrE
MSVMRSKMPAKYFPLKWKMFNTPILALVFSASATWAQAPAVVIDAQQNIGPPIGDPAYGQPEAIAVAPNGTVYIADTNNNQILGLETNLPGNSTQQPVLHTTFNLGGKESTLVSPQALAVDAAGDLYIGDTPTTGGRILEMTANAAGALTGNVKLIHSGAPLVNPIALTVDSTNTLFIGDWPPVSGDGVIYSLAAGHTALTPLTFTGIPADFTPAALVRDSLGNLYIADNGGDPGGDNVNGNVYKALATGGAAVAVSAQTFIIEQPSGLALDTAGDLFILTKLANDTGAGQQVVEIPAAPPTTPTTPYIIPNTGLGNSSSMAMDPNGNLDVLQLTPGAATQLAFVTPVNLGSVSVGATGTPISFNFEFNAPATLSGFRALTLGDVGSEVTEDSGGTCSTVPATISPYTPYTCTEAFAGKPQYPGTRISAIQVEGATSTSILGSSSVYETGTSAAEVTYPLDSTTTPDTFQQPQGVAISGLNNTVYIADSFSGKVYSTPYLTGTTFTPVSTGSFLLSAPSAVALDGQGDLYIADFNLGEVIKVPTTSGQAPSLVATNVAGGGLLQHPIALTIDYLGNLYVGDAGPAGEDASRTTPGYVVKISSNGSPSKVTIPSGVRIIFPQALATDSEADLLIGDGGADVVPSDGQIVKVSAAGTASVVRAEGVTTPTNPVGLAFDAAGQLYVVDGTVGTFTVIPPTGNGFQIAFSTTLSAPSALAASAGTQSFVISNVGNATSNSLVYLNGNSSTLAFGDVAERQSKTLSATVRNIGNEDLTLGSPYLEEIVDNPVFTISGTTTCSNGEELDSATSCVIGVRFTPAATGFTSAVAAVESSAYNNGIPVVNFNGTGTAGGFGRNTEDNEAKPRSTGTRGRKSFQSAGRQSQERSDDGRDHDAH